MSDFWRDFLLVVLLAGMFGFAGFAGFVLAMLASGRWPR